MRSALVFALIFVACKRDEAKVCPDPVSAPSTAKNVATMRTIDVPIPKAIAFGDAVPILSLSIAASGETFVNGDAVADDKAITEAAKKALAANPATKAIIQADRSVTYGRLIQVLDRLRLGGLANIAFGVSAPPPSP